MSSQITYRLLHSSDEKSVASLFAETFIHEPLAMLYSTPQSDLYTFGKFFFQHCLKQAHSFVACDDNRVVGFFLCQDWYKPFDIDIPVMKPICDVLEQLHQKCNWPPAETPSQVYHMACIGVDTTYRKKGIARELFKRCIENAISNKFKTLFVECTSAFSTRLALAFHFQPLASILYEKNIDNVHSTGTFMELKVVN